MTQRANASSWRWQYCSVFWSLEFEMSDAFQAPCTKTLKRTKLLVRQAFTCRNLVHSRVPHPVRDYKRASIGTFASTLAQLKPATKIRFLVPHATRTVSVHVNKTSFYIFVLLGDTHTIERKSVIKGMAYRHLPTFDWLEWLRQHSRHFASKTHYTRKV